MPALFTDPPELTVSTPELPKPNSPGNSVGVLPSQRIFRYGGDTYMVSIANRDPDTTDVSNPMVARRVAGGPWIPLDQPNNPPHTDIWEQFFIYQSQCQIGSILHFATTVPDPWILAYFTFDLAGGGYSALQQPYWHPSTRINDERSSQPLIRSLSDGRCIIVWGSPDITMTGARFAFVLGGGVGSANTLVGELTGQFITIVGLVVDDNDVAHVLYNRFFSGNNLIHVAISNSGSVGSPQILESPVAWTYTFGPGCLFNGKVTFCGSHAFDPNIYLWELDPATNAWAKKTVAARVGDTSGSIYPCQTVVSPTRLYIAWPENDARPGIYPAETATMQYSIYDGTSFTPKEVAWHVGDNPYPPASIGGPPAHAPVPSGDHHISYPSIAYSDGFLRMLGYSDYTGEFDQTELYLEVPIVGHHRSRVY